MTPKPAPEIKAAEVVLPCPPLEETVAFFTERLGFRVALVFPADHPTAIVVVGHGLRVRLERAGPGTPGVLRLLCADPGAMAGGALELVAPNGTRIELQAEDPPLELPPPRPTFVVTGGETAVPWGVGRAGMLYRDLVPDRQGGRFIASHIRIPGGGPVPDYVHFHRIHFQMIYCYKGWVRVVYEDQGPPFVMQAGDCVLQPPRIRHRVLESSPGLEVVEVSCPAEHETLADLEMELPTPGRNADGEFSGQRFVRHQAATAVWGPGRVEGFETRDLGIGAATSGVASARVARRAAPARPASPSSLPPPPTRHDAEFLFSFVLAGAATLTCEGHGTQRLGPGHAFVVPSGLLHALADCSSDLELLEVALPAGFHTQAC